MSETSGGRRRRLADMRASLADGALAMLTDRAEEALATEGVTSTRLGYDVSVKLNLEELFEPEGHRLSVRTDAAHAPPGVPEP